MASPLGGEMREIRDFDRLYSRMEFRKVHKRGVVTFKYQKPKERGRDLLGERPTHSTALHLPPTKKREKRAGNGTEPRCYFIMYTYTYTLYNVLYNVFSTRSSTSQSAL